jgi:hypothetical protein
MAKHEFKKGNPGGPGRPKGSKDKRGARVLAAELRERILRSDLTPLGFLMEVMQDEERFLEDRIDAAKAAAPYIHQKMPTKLDLGGEINIIPPYLPGKRQ